MKIQKRGLLLIVLGTFLLICAVFSSGQNTGCCTNPFIQTCEDITAEECCAEDASCKEKYFYENYACNNLPGNLNYLCAEEGGYCLGKDEETIENQQYCKYVNPLALCLNQTAVYPGEIPPSECAEGCCICEKAGVKTYDQQDVIKTEFECDRLFCASLVGYSTIFNTSITNEAECRALAQLVELANLSGYIKDSLNNAVVGASISIAGKTNTTNASGFYRIEGLRAGTGIQITVSKTGYITNTSAINLIPGENNYNFTLQSTQTGTLEGTVNSSVAGPVGGVAIWIAGKSATTNQNGVYSISGIPFGKYTLTASHPNFNTFSEEIIINQDYTTKNIILIPTLFASIEGIVADAATTNAIGNAEVTITGSLGTFTAISSNVAGPQKGFYRITNIPADPGNQYTIRARADGFNPLSPIQIILTVGTTHTININLTQIQPGCGIDQCTAPNDFSVNHVLGKKAARLSWTTPCNTVPGFEIVKKQDNQIIETIPISTFPSITFYSYEDTNVSWNTNYNYEIKAFYPESSCKISSTVSRTIALGDAMCEGRYDYSAGRWIGFCEGNYLRKECNNENRVFLKENCSTITPTGSFFCSGPDRYGNAYCKNSVGCSAANTPPFGICQNPSNCYGINYLNYCFLDQHPTYSQFKICKSCTQLSSCFDYGSKDSCELDNSTCLKANGSVCVWKNTSTPNYNQGFCYPLNYKGTDKCRLCDITKYPTIGLQCTQDICQLLGNCFSAQDLSTCRQCAQGTTKCEDYKSEAECVGSAGAQGIHFENECIIVNSNDRCGLGVCKWTGTECVKDGDLNGAKDPCTAESCQKDTLPPTTTIVQNGSSQIVISINNNEVEFNSNEQASKIEYCITTTPDICCPADAIKEIGIGGIENLKQYLEEHNINPNNNTYYLKYWATDVNFNREQTKTKTITADINEPVITIYEDEPLFVGVEDKASLNINININERVRCNDSLTGPKSSSQISSEMLDIGITKTVVYTDLLEGDYFYSITCTDMAGNSKTESKTISVKKPFITLVTPELVTNELSFLFRIKTLKQATCELYERDIFKESFVQDIENILNVPLTPNERLYISTTRYDVGSGAEAEIPPNLFINYFSIKCTDTTGKTYEKTLKFTTDRIGPVTEFTAIDYSGARYTKEQVANKYFSKSINIELKCKDLPFDESGKERGFGCKETKWCNTSIGEDCNPDTIYNGIFSVSNSKRICYQSWDYKNYSSDKECVDLIVAEELAIFLLEPKNESEIDGDEVVLNKPGFDIKIETKTTKTVSSCVFAAYPGFNYSTQLVTEGGKYKFNETTTYQWIYQNYPYRFANKNFTLLPDPATGEIFDRSDMYLQCQLSTGEILPTMPKHYKFIYDPTPPNIIKYYATTIADLEQSPEGVEIIDINEPVYLRVDVNDRSICKYDDENSEYNRMRNSFSFWREDNHIYKYIAMVDKNKIATDAKTYYYYVACKNRAGNVSVTKTISFYTNFKRDKLITLAKVDPLLKVVKGKRIIDNANLSSLGGVILTIGTSHSTIGCYYSASSNFNFNNYQTGTKLTALSTEPKKHVSGILSLSEGSYNYRVICDFDGVTKKDVYINFVIDQSPPTILNITLDAVCSKTSIAPQFDAEDNLSGISEYKYRILKVTTPITNWTITDDKNPSITGLNLTINQTYIIELTAKDNAGNWIADANSVKKEFMVLNPDSLECVGDDTPPVVTINETIVDSRIEATITCYDKYGCNPIKYGFANTAPNCNPNAYDYYIPITLIPPTYLCWNVSDTNGNIASGIKYIAINDSDGDGILNEADVCDNTPANEVYSIVLNETSPNYGCGPSEIDTDGDGLPDFWENQYSSASCLLDSNKTDSNANGISDANEDCDEDGKTNYMEYLQGLNPTIPNLADSDSDGITDNIDTCPNTPVNEIADSAGCSDSQKDSDKDGMNDKWEKTYGLNYLDPADANTDKDGDGLTNKEEYDARTDPTKKDTDGDKYSDKKEIDKGTNPLDETSFPTGIGAFTIIIIIFIIILLLGGAGYFAYIYREQIKEMFVPKAPAAGPAIPPKPTIPTRPAEIRRPTISEEIERKRVEELKKKRIETKRKKREKMFEVFEKPGEKPKPEKIPKIEEKPKLVIKPEEKKVLKPLAEVIKIPEEKKEFERLAELTAEHIMKGKPIEELLKITKVPKEKEDEFKKLTALIEKKVLPEKKKKKELTTEQKAKIKNIFSSLSEISPKKEAAPFEKLAKMAKKKIKNL